MDEETRRILAVPSVRKTLELVGLTAILWNEVEVIWYLIFTCLFHDAPRNKVDNIYQQFVTGSSKRELTLNLSLVAFAANPDMKREISWLSARTTELSGLRNAVVHGDYHLDILNGPPGLRISPSGSHNRKPNRLAKAGVAVSAEISNIADQISALIDDLDNFRIFLLQNFLPEAERSKPIEGDAFKALPEALRRTLPQELRERAVLRSIPKTHSKPPRRKR